MGRESLREVLLEPSTKKMHDKMRGQPSHGWRADGASLQDICCLEALSLK